MNRRPAPKRRIRVTLIAVTVLGILATAAEFVLTDSVPEDWQFQYLPRWAQYSTLVLGLLLCFPGIPTLPTRDKQPGPDDFKCIHCGTLIRPVDNSCPKCGWDWMLKNT